MMKKRPVSKLRARKRAEVIMKVRCGLMSASQAAEKLGISRKTYYKWEQRGLAELLTGLEDQAPGRPAKPEDRRHQALAKQLNQAHREIVLLQHKMALKDVLTDLKLAPGTDRAKKNKRIGQALAMIAELKNRYAVSNRWIARQVGLSYATLMRWKRRLAAGKAPMEKPGPKKVKPLDLGQLSQKIRDLNHGLKRSHGTGRLHETFHDAVSRRELDRMIAKVRRETRRQRADEMCHITWLKPNLAWAMGRLREKACRTRKKDPSA